MSLYITNSHSSAVGQSHGTNVQQNWKEKEKNDDDIAAAADELQVFMLRS